MSESEIVQKNYLEKIGLKTDTQNKNAEVYAGDELLATGYVRVFTSDYGPMIELAPEHIKPQLIKRNRTLMRGAFSIFRTSKGTEFQKCIFTPTTKRTPNGDLSCNGRRSGPYYSGVRSGFYYKKIHRVCLVFENEEHQAERSKLQPLLRRLPSYIPNRKSQNKKFSQKIMSSPAPWAPFAPSFLGPPGPPLPKQHPPPQRFRPPRAPRQAPRPAPPAPDANFAAIIANLNAYLTANPPPKKTHTLHNERQNNIRENWHDR